MGAGGARIGCPAGFSWPWGRCGRVHAWKIKFPKNNGARTLVHWESADGTGVRAKWFALTLPPRALPTMQRKERYATHTAQTNAGAHVCVPTSRMDHALGRFHFSDFYSPNFLVQKNCVCTGPRALEEGSGPPRPRTLDPRVLSTDPCSVPTVPAALGRRPLKLKSVNGKSAIQFGEIQALIIATTTPHR